MPRIQTVRAREILDSRGTPTVEVDVVLDGGALGRASVPSGASRGSHEAHELRDGAERFSGKGVTGAVEVVHGEIRVALCGGQYGQYELDETLRSLDGTANKERLGGNTVLAVSLAFAKACAENEQLPLFRYLQRLTETELSLPRGMFNIINGGVHADSGISFQEFMVIPQLSDSWQECLRAASEIYHTLKHELHVAGFATSVGDEGGFAPRLANNREALSLIERSVTQAGYTPGEDVLLALDVAANELASTGGYTVDGELLKATDLIAYYRALASEYPVAMIEDPFSEDDTGSFEQLVRERIPGLSVVGDDLFVTNAVRLRNGSEHRRAQAIIIKPNQVGTLTETLETVKVARENGITPIISHRSGETEDVFIAHLAVASGAPYIKSGAPARGERTAKYNELLRIEEALKH